IRRLAGDRMALALQAVKAGLGPEAVILETAAAGAQVVVTAAVDDEEATGKADGELTREVRALLAVVHKLLDERWRGSTEDMRPEVAALHHRLVAQGVEGVIAAALVRATAERLEDGLPVAAARAGAPPG